MDTATLPEVSALRNDSDDARRQRRRIAVLLLIAIWIIADIPMFMTFLPQSHDSAFHLYRIQGIAEGLRNGDFPVRMQYAQIQGFGYPVSIMYGDIFLYPAAILHLLGLSVNTSYKMFVLVLNAFTIGTTYLIVRRVFRSSYIAIIASALWTLAPYRLVDVYLRGAVGEYAALFFLPILLYGLYAIVFESNGFAWIWAAIGISGVILSHVISVIMVFIPVIILLAAGLVRNHSLRALGQIGLSLAATFGLCAWWIIPFLDYYRNTNLKASSINLEANIANVQAHAPQLAQLFMLFVPMDGNSKTGDNQLPQDMPFSVGWAILAGVALFAMACLLRSRTLDAQQLRFRRIGLVMLPAAALVALMVTNLFPWVYTTHSVWNYVIGFIASIQFSWRLIGVLSVLLVILVCIGMYVINHDAQYAFVGRAMGAAILLIAMLEGGMSATSWLQNTNAKPVGSYSTLQAEHFGWDGVMAGEYLPAEFDTNILANKQNIPVASNEVVTSDVAKHGGSVGFTVGNASKGSSVMVPLLMYPNYQIVSQAKGYASLSAGENGVMTVEFHKAYSGEVDIAYVEPVLWRIAEVVSLVSIIAMVAVPLAGRLRGARESNESREKNKKTMRHGSEL